MASVVIRQMSLLRLGTSYRLRLDNATANSDNYRMKTKAPPKNRFEFHCGDRLARHIVEASGRNLGAFMRDHFAKHFGDVSLAEYPRPGRPKISKRNGKFR